MRSGARVRVSGSIKRERKTETSPQDISCLRVFIF